MARIKIQYSLDNNGILRLIPGLSLLKNILDSSLVMNRKATPIDWSLFCYPSLSNRKGNFRVSVAKTNSPRSLGGII
jgi:hypothetical protein